VRDQRTITGLSAGERDRVDIERQSDTASDLAHLALAKCR
jgi:hypothetical protein